LPEYLAKLESRDEAVTRNKRYYVQVVLRTLPHDTDLAPLRRMPSTSFAFQTIQDVLKSTNPTPGSNGGAMESKKAPG
jgi:hypothetical protein